MKEEKMSKPTFFQVLKSVFAGLIGVQSKANQQRDFTEGQPFSYILVSIMMTILVVLTLILMVNLIV
jgi:hypothetical protein